MDRRRFLIGSGLAVATSVSTGVWRPFFVDVGAAVNGPGPYGALGAVDANGLQLPAGFTSRVIATTNSPLGASNFLWHSAPDGGACFPASGGGWVYVSNAEVGTSAGGASAVRFLADGQVDDAYTILSGTSRNCAGGPTPWGTWLSCEENGATARVYECNPQQSGQGIRRDALGQFNHEAVAIDPTTGSLYLTEDDPAGRFYRFQPTVPGDLSAGSLFAASVSGNTITWVPTSATAPARAGNTTAFNGGEGIWYDDGSVFFTTKGDRRVWEYVPATGALTVIHDCATTTSALTQVDNITVHPASGDMFIAEDGGNMELCIIGVVNGVRQVAAFARINGHSTSEVTGPAFSPDGTRLYLSSQRGSDGTTGVTYEVTGPFRTDVGNPLPVISILPVVADAYVKGGPTANTNYGTATLLQVKSDASETYVRVSYLTVDIASLTGPVTDAILRLTSRVASGPVSEVQVLGVTNTAWTESGLTWANRPAAGPVLGSFTMTSLNATQYEVDVTSWVAARRAEGATKVSFLLRQAQLVTTLAAINSREMSTGRPELEVTVDSGPPPPNVAPTAAFTETITGLTVAVNGGTSNDPDGTITNYAWNFGDGATATGATASHTYAAAGTYTVSLTVGDDDGDTGVTSRSITVTVPTVTVLAADAFGRTVSNGFGSADVGGAWTAAGGSVNFAVNGGQGRITLPTANVARAATLASVAGGDVDATATLALDKVPTGGGTYLGLVVRKIGNSEYRLRVRVQPTSTTRQLLRVLNNVETVLVTQTVPGVVYTPGTPVRIRLKATGSGTTAIAAKVWFGSDPEPAAFQIQVNDTTATLQQPGGVGVHAYTSSTTSNAPLVMTVDDLDVRVPPA